VVDAGWLASDAQGWAANGWMAKRLLEDPRVSPGCPYTSPIAPHSWPAPSGENSAIARQRWARLGSIVVNVG
jgi:hypothetical protein